jgi:DNA-binding FadR family transcriptional regulator
MKSGQRLAGMIEEYILDKRLTAGTNLGSETELIARYGTSRPVFREAVRLVEHDGLATMRKGPSGGLIVIEPSPRAATHAAAVWLRRNRANVDELFATRELLEPSCAARAAEATSPESRERLLAILERQETLAARADFPAYNQCVHEFHQAIAELSGNRVCWLFLQTLGELTIAFAGASSYTEDELAESEQAHRLIAEAINAGDAATASHRMIVHLRASREFGLHLHDTSNIMSRPRRRRARPQRD